MKIRQQTERSTDKLGSKRQRGADPYVSELDDAELAEVGDDTVRGLDGDDELHEAHLLRSHVVHRWQVVEELHLERVPSLTCISDLKGRCRTRE